MRREFLPLWALCLCAGSCSQVDALFCGGAGCEFSEAEWARLKSIAGLPQLPPADLSNKYEDSDDARRLGQAMYFDTRNSGAANLTDALGRPTPYARAAAGQPIKTACATCHDPTNAGSDTTSVPSHVSIGAGWYAFNVQQTVNSGFNNIMYWNGRSDSLWSQALGVTESAVSMNGSRLRTTWLMRDTWAELYQRAFGVALPQPTTSAELTTGLEVLVSPEGKRFDTVQVCKLVNSACPAECRVATDGVCWPRFPVEGKPGATPGCQPFSDARKASEPFADAFDCMESADQELINQAFARYGKAVAAYERELVSRDSRFDRWVEEGPASALLNESERRGARLFVGKAACIDCHNTPLLSDGQFHNIGVPQAGDRVPTVGECLAGTRCDCENGRNCIPWGAADGLAQLKTNPWRRDARFSDDPTFAGSGAYYALDLTDGALKGAWRTPGLRDVALTRPYMHDGLYETLQEVVWHYNRGGDNQGYAGTKSVRLKPLGLSETDQADLVNFLGTLTGAPLPAALLTKPAGVP